MADGIHSSPFVTRQLIHGPLVEGVPGATNAVSDARAIELIEACFSANATRALLHPENLPPDFFDLSSRQAGEMLQRLRLYGIRLAILLPPEGVATSSRFGEMVAEERRGRDFAIFDDREAAERWLTDE